MALTLPKTPISRNALLRGRAGVRLRWASLGGGGASARTRKRKEIREAAGGPSCPPPRVEQLIAAAAAWPARTPDDPAGRLDWCRPSRSPGPRPAQLPAG